MHEWEEQTKEPPHLLALKPSLKTDNWQQTYDLLLLSHVSHIEQGLCFNITYEYQDFLTDSSDLSIRSENLLQKCWDCRFVKTRFEALLL